MPARCHNDSCSVEWSEVSTLSGLAFEANVVLDPDGSLVCTEGEGVGVLVNPAAGNLITQSVAGLLATLPEARIVSFSDATNSQVQDAQEIPGGETDSSLLRFIRTQIRALLSS